MTFLLFGSSGFLGKRLVSFLRNCGEGVIAVQRSRAEEYNVDITDQHAFAILRDIKAIDIIINCASLLPDSSKMVYDVDYNDKLFKTNVIGSINILNFAAAKGIKKVINCSTLVVNNKPWPVPMYENYIEYPTGNHVGYSVSKLSQELIMNEVAARHNIQLTHLRLSALYGVDMKWQGILPLLIDKAKRGENIVLTNGHKVSFDFLHIEDLVRIIHLLSLKEQWQYKVINTASGEEIFLDHLAKKIIMHTKSSSVLELRDDEQPISRSVVDVSILRDMIGTDFYTTPIDDGIKELVSAKSKI